MVAHGSKGAVQNLQLEVTLVTRFPLSPIVIMFIIEDGHFSKLFYNLKFYRI